MFCFACSVPARDRLCVRCASMLAPAPELRLDGLLVVAAFVHDGAARRLVHALKYRGVTAAARPFALELVARLPASVTALVPVPRAVGRAVRYGVDPAAELANALSRPTGIPVVSALLPPLWWPRHAGAERGKRSAIRFRRRLSLEPGAALVDDVVTTGSTVMAAARALDGLPALVLAATVVPRVRSDSPSGGRVTGARPAAQIPQPTPASRPSSSPPGGVRLPGQHQGREFE